MTDRIYNFSAGPAVLPVEVLEQAQRELLSLPGVGMSVMEISHRSKTFEQIIGKAEMGLRELLGVPDDYHILLLQGGASLQFSMVAMNLLPSGAGADYIVTGSWGKKAVKEAKRCGAVNIARTWPMVALHEFPMPTKSSSIPTQPTCTSLPTRRLRASNGNASQMWVRCLSSLTLVRHLVASDTGREVWTHLWWCAEEYGTKRRHARDYPGRPCSANS